MGIELLESRITPSNILAVVAGHTLKITGTSDADHLLVTGDTSDPTIIHLQGLSGDTVNGMTDFKTTFGIDNILINLGNGDDALTFDTSGAQVHLKGSLTILGGNGAKILTATDLTVNGNLAISYGINIGVDNSNFTDLTVLGGMTFTTKSGNTDFAFQRDTGGESYILKNFTVKNGTGQDFLRLQDMSVGGFLSVNDGHGSGTTTSVVTISNSHNTNFPAQFGKGISVSFLDGPTVFILDDANVAGNVTLHGGSGLAHASIQANVYLQPVTIDGSLSISGTGTAEVELGSADGLNIGKSLAVQTGQSGTATFFGVRVGGATSISAAGGTQTVSIDDTTFAGSFTDTAPQGGATISIETTSNTSAATVFEKPFNFLLGKPSAAPSFLTFAGTDDGFEVMVFDSLADVIQDGAGSSVTEGMGHVEQYF